MAGRKQHGSTEASLEKMVEVMIELANRGRSQEELVMRIAKAGGITEVIKHLTRMRKYVKSHSPALRAAHVINGAVARAGKSRSRKRAIKEAAHSGEAGAGQEATA